MQLIHATRWSVRRKNLFRPWSPEYQRECWTVGVLAHLFLDIAVLGDGSASQNLKIKTIQKM
jgi:hypothetical protein